MSGVLFFLHFSLTENCRVFHLNSELHFRIESCKDSIGYLDECFYEYYAESDFYLQFIVVIQW